MEEKKDVLLEKFMRAHALLHRYQHHRAMQAGHPGSIHRGQGRLLAMLRVKPGISQKDLSYLLGMRSQSVGELLSKLERNGYITRTPSEADRRAMDISLTEEGERAAEQTEKQREDIENLFDFLSEEDRVTMDRLLTNLIEELSANFGEDEGGFGFPPMNGRHGWGECPHGGPHHPHHPHHPHGEHPHGEHPHGERPHGEHPHGEHPHGEHPHGERPHGERPHGEHPHGEHPHGERPHGERPHGESRPQEAPDAASREL